MGMTNVALCLQKSIEDAMAGASMKDAGSTATASPLTVPTDASIAGDIASIKTTLETMCRSMNAMEGRMVEMDVRLTGRIDNVMTRLVQVELRYATYGF